MIRYTQFVGVLALASILAEPAVAQISPQPVATTQGMRTLVSLDVTTVTANTPVNVLAAGHATAGGFITIQYVTPGATSPTMACFNQKGPAGTVTSGDTMCTLVGNSYLVFPSALPVSMNVASGTVTIAGYGFTP